MAHFRFDSNFEKRTFSIAPEGIVELFVDARYMPICAQPYGGSELLIEYYASEDYPYSAHVENGIVMLDCPQSARTGGIGGMLNMFMSSLGGANWQELPITIHVPRTYAGMLNLCTSCAKVSARSLELRSRLHALTSNAAIDMRGVIATAFEFSTSNAKVYAEDAAACGEPDGFGGLRPAECKLSSSNGAIDLCGFSTLGALTCHTSNGAIKLRDTAVQGELNCSTTNASIHLDSVSAQDTAWIHASNGAVKLSRLLARNIDIRTSNSGIKGSIVGRAADFKTDCGTSNGKCSPACSNIDTGRFLRAHTSNANIALEFTD